MLPHFGPLGAFLGWCLTSFDGKSPSTSNHNFRAFQLSDFNQLMVVSFPWWVSARKCMYLSIIKVSLWLHLFCVGLNEAWVLIRSPKDNIRVSGLTSTTWWLWGTELRLTSAWVAFPGGPPRWCVFVVRNYPLFFFLSSGIVSFQFGYWVLTNILSPKSPVPFLIFPQCLCNTFSDAENTSSQHDKSIPSFALSPNTLTTALEWQLQCDCQQGDNCKEIIFNSAFVWGDRSPRDALLSAVVPTHGTAFLWPFAASVLDSAAHGSPTCCFRFARTAYF